MIRNLMFLLAFLGPFAQCTQESKSTEQSGLKIENTPTRGLGFTDTLGTEYGLVYITTTMTNVSSISIHIQMALPYEYDYPIAYGDQKFNLSLWPKLTGDQVTSLASMGNVLSNFFGKDLDTPHILNETLEPGEKSVATIGTLFPRSAVNCSATPYMLFEYSDTGIFPSCEWPMNEDRAIPIAIGTQFALGLKVGFCTIGEVYESCTFIPCGQISYPKLFKNTE